MASRSGKPFTTELLTHNQWVTAIYSYLVNERNLEQGNYVIDCTINADKSLKVDLFKDTQ